MTGYSKNPVSWILPAAMIIALLVLVFGCESTKNLDKSSKSSESKEKIDSSAYFHEKIDSLQRTITEERRLRKLGVNFNQPISRQPIIIKLNADSSGFIACPACPENEINIDQDGSIHAKGDINSFIYDEDQYKKYIVELINEREKETSLRIEAERKQKEAESKKTVVKETKIMTRWWMWYLAGALTVLAIWIYISWKIHRVKKLASLETYYRNAKM